MKHIDYKIKTSSALQDEMINLVKESLLNFSKLKRTFIGTENKKLISLIIFTQWHLLKSIFKTFEELKPCPFMELEMDLINWVKEIYQKELESSEFTR